VLDQRRQLGREPVAGGGEVARRIAQRVECRRDGFKLRIELRVLRAELKGVPGTWQLYLAER
jgi:hypothetical protein